MISEAGDELEIGTEFQLIEKGIAVPVEVINRSQELPDAEPVDETQGREEILAHLLEDNIAAPGFIGQIQRNRGRVIIADGV